jgi:YVTN family beta-propeller protein
MAWRPSVMKRKPHSRRKRTSTKSVLRLPDLEHAKTAVLDGQRIYTANNERGSVSVLDVRARTLVATIPISKKVQRISITRWQVHIYAGPANTPHRGHRYSNQRGRPIDFPPEDSVLFRNHKRRALAPCQFRIRKALRRRVRCGRTLQK